MESYVDAPGERLRVWSWRDGLALWASFVLFLAVIYVVASAAVALVTFIMSAAVSVVSGEWFHRTRSIWTAGAGIGWGPIVSLVGGAAILAVIYWLVATFDDMAPLRSWSSADGAK